MIEAMSETATGEPRPHPYRGERSLWTSRDRKTNEGRKSKLLYPQLRVCTAPESLVEVRYQTGYVVSRHNRSRF